MMIYQCTRPDCDEIFPSLLKGRIHVHKDHGIAWKQTRKWLTTKIHESPDIELLKSEKDEKAREIAVLLEKSRRRGGAKRRKLNKTQLVDESAYKSYINKSPKNRPSEVQE